jgi:hypothetical protein
VFHIWAVWPSFWPQVNHIKTWPRNQHFWLVSKICGSKQKPQGCFIFLYIFGLYDLVYDHRRPILKPDLEIIKTTFITNLQDNWIQIIASSVIWAVSLCFFPKMTQIRTLLRNNINYISYKFSGYLDWNGSPNSVDKVFSSPELAQGELLGSVNVRRPSYVHNCLCTL